MGEVHWGCGVWVRLHGPFEALRLWGSGAPSLGVDASLSCAALDTSLPRSAHSSKQSKQHTW